MQTRGYKRKTSVSDDEDTSPKKPKVDGDNHTEAHDKEQEKKAQRERARAWFASQQGTEKVESLSYSPSVSDQKAKARQYRNQLAEKERRNTVAMSPSQRSKVEKLTEEYVKVSQSTATGLRKEGNMRYSSSTRTSNVMVNQDRVRIPPLASMAEDKEKHEVTVVTSPAETKPAEDSRPTEDGPTVDQPTEDKPTDDKPTEIMKSDAQRSYGVSSAEIDSIDSSGDMSAMSVILLCFVVGVLAASFLYTDVCKQYIGTIKYRFYQMDAIFKYAVGDTSTPCSSCAMAVTVIGMVLFYSFFGREN